jgi:acetyl-CoA carboxylase alpha subunit
MAGPARIGGHDVELALFDFSFFGGSMGEVAGERLARSMERASARKVPFILRTETGGARMQEGMRSLAQMPKVVSARIGLADASVPFIAVLGHPTTGGVLAGLAALADMTVAEAGATIGFAGPRVAEGFTGEPLTGISHSAETALAAGLVDDVVEPGEVRDYLERALNTLAPDDPAAEEVPEQRTDGQVRSAWDAVEAARSSERRLGFELLLEIADSMIELRGDRQGEDDPALDAAVVRIRGRKVVALAMDRERIPGPGAFRKARRCIDLAGRLGLPVVTFVDTKGADPSERSESTGIAWEIAALFETLMRVPVPTLSIVIGEGGSGGALAFACTDVLLMFEDAIFSVIGPEMAAQILWRDPTMAPKAAEHLKLTAASLVELGIADAVLPEPLAAGTAAAAIAYHLGRFEGTDRAPADRLARRLERWRNRHAD